MSFKTHQRSPGVLLLKVMLGYALFCLVFYWASGEQLFYTSKYTDSVTATKTAAIMVDQTTVSFAIKAETDYSDYISLLIGTGGRENPGSLLVELLDANEAVLTQQVLVTEGLSDYIYQHIFWHEPVRVHPGKTYTVRIKSVDVPEGYGVSLWYGDSISTGRFTVGIEDVGIFYVNGEEIKGTICYKTAGRNELKIGSCYWYIVGVIGLLILLYGLRTIDCGKRGRENRVLKWMDIYRNYAFLIRQLVARDFKRKYKRSILGALWSFLNPLLTMLVQYLVFSTLFKSSIENFVVYLLSGIVTFNFFNEAVGMGLTSITDNAHLINKVYMPKVIYPFARVLSSTVNLLIALLPLLGAAILSGLPITKAIVLLPLGLLMLFVFCFGMSMLLSTAMVYFRDTLFLWGVFSTLWAYLTPTFYPISIVPAKLLSLFKLNPMYQYVTFVRFVLMEGIAPPPTVYIGCFLSAAVALLAGWMVFKKKETHFILHL